MKLLRQILLGSIQTCTLVVVATSIQAQQITERNIDSAFAQSSAQSAKPDLGLNLAPGQSVVATS